MVHNNIIGLAHEHFIQTVSQHSYSQCQAEDEAEPSEEDWIRSAAAIESCPQQRGDKSYREHNAYDKPVESGITGVAISQHGTDFVKMENMKTHPLRQMQEWPATFAARVDSFTATSAAPVSSPNRKTPTGHRRVVSLRPFRQPALQRRVVMRSAQHPRRTPSLFVDFEIAGKRNPIDFCLTASARPGGRISVGTISIL